MKEVHRKITPNGKLPKMAFPQLLVWQVLTLSSEKIFSFFFDRLLLYFLHVYHIITVF